MPLIESQIRLLHDIDCIIHFANGTEENFVIEAANGDDPFMLRISPIGESLYRDKNNNYRRGSREYRVHLLFDYNNHYMELNKLFASIQVDFDFGNFTLPFTNTEFKFNNESVKKNWLESNPVTKKWYTKEGANPFPSGSANLEFVSIDTWRM